MLGLRSYTWARDEIARLDPTVDYNRIAHLYAEVRFGWPPLSAAFYTATFVRQAAVPSIACTLHRGGGGASLTGARKRNDDTLVFFGELFAHGASSERGSEVVERMQQIHGHFSISDEDYRYTLCSIIDEPERAAEVVGYSSVSWAEYEAWFRFWRELGEQMGLDGLPNSYREARAMAHDYERDRWAPTTAGRAVADAVIGDYVARYVPRPLHRIATQGVHALLGSQVCEVHGYAPPPRLVAALVLGGLGLYLRARRLLPDPPLRPVTQSFGGAYGACPHLADVGYRASGGAPQTSSNVPAR